MHYTLNDMMFSRAGLGTVKFGRNEGVKYPRSFELPDDKAVRNLLALAYELGINVLDTAPAYGNSEARLGELLPMRHDWLICTKVGELFENGQSRFDFSEKGVKESIQQSLKRLKRDYLDVVLIHSDGDDLAILENTETVATLQHLKQEGVIRAIGLSGKTAEGGVAALRDYNLDIAMVMHNVHYQAEQRVIDTARDLGKGIMVKKAFASGHLFTQQADTVIDTMSHIFSHRDMALSVILGTINPEHLRENLCAIERVITRASQ